MSDVPFHPVAAIFPLLTEKDLDALIADIREHGLREPIETLNGAILDGRNRYRACLLAGIKPVFCETTTNDPVAYVVSKNLHRRHLTETQRGLIGARIKEEYAKLAKERQREHGGTAPGKNTCGKSATSDSGKARDQAGAAVGVSGKTVDYGTKLLHGGCPELIAAADADQVAISTAARMAGKPHDEQREWLASAGGKKRARKNEVTEPSENNGPEHSQPPGKRRGVGVIRANEAVNCLTRIPKNDPLRKRGFQIVTDWIRHNR